MNKIKLTLSLSLILFSLTRCTHRGPVDGGTDSLSPVEVHGEAESPAEEPVASPKLFESKKYHAFSSPGKQDLFTISVTGDSSNYQKAKVVFKVYSWDNKEIYSDSFEGSYLIDYGILQKTNNPEKITDELRERYIKERLEKFFDDLNFKKPAVARNAKIDEHYSSKKLFEELQKNENSIAFFYLLGKEDGRHISYSSELGKAVVFYNCC